MGSRLLESGLFARHGEFDGGLFTRRGKFHAVLTPCQETDGGGRAARVCWVARWRGTAHGLFGQQERWTGAAVGRMDADRVDCAFYKARGGFEVLRNIEFGVVVCINLQILGRLEAKRLVEVESRIDAIKI